MLLDPLIVLSLDGLARASIKSLQSYVMYSTTTTTEQHTPLAHQCIRLIQRTTPHQLRLSTRIITYHIVLSYANIWITHVSSSITITEEKNASPRKWVLYYIRSLQGYVTDPVERPTYNVLGRSFFTTNKEIPEWIALSAH